MSDFSELDQIDELEDDVGLEEEDAKHASNDKNKWFRGEKDRSYRVSFLYFHTAMITAVMNYRKQCKEEGKKPSREDEIKVAKEAMAEQAKRYGKDSWESLEPWQQLDIRKVQFKKILAHYKKGFGYAISRLGKDGAEADAVWKRLGDVKKYFTTVLLVYPTNNKGELDKEAFKRGDFTVIPWRLSSKVYGQLHEESSSLRANDLNIATQDLIITCTNSEFQNFDKMRVGGKALWRMHEKFKENILKLALEYYDDLVPFREMSTADLRIKLNLDSGDGGGGSDEDVSDSDMNDLFDNV